MKKFKNALFIIIIIALFVSGIVFGVLCWNFLSQWNIILRIIVLIIAVIGTWAIELAIAVCIYLIYCQITKQF